VSPCRLAYKQRVRSVGHSEMDGRLIVIGRDATEAFNDVGHSDEARAMLPKMLLGDFKGEVSAWFAG
jgi:hypothetical protein